MSRDRYAVLADAVLLGGPVTFPEDQRRLRVAAEQDKIKVAHGAG